MRTTTVQSARKAGGPLVVAFNVYTGEPEGASGPTAVFAAARLGLEPPRFCAQCGRRMIVQVRPDGWSARCSRHDTLDSRDLEEQR